MAIALPDSLTTDLEQLQNQLKPFARDAKWVKVIGIHLTLKFLGYVEPEAISTIQESLTEIAKGKSHPFRYEQTAVVFSRMRGGRTYCGWA